MARILEPVLRRVVSPAALTAGTLTAFDVNFDFGSLQGALIIGIDGTFEPSTITNADDRSMALIARPDYAVVATGDPREPWGDPDFLAGVAYRTSFSTNGGMIEPLSVYEKLMEPWLIHRNMSVLFFDDNAVALRMGIWYKNVLLSEPDLISLLAGRR